MIVSCPACETRFAVDDSLIGPTGRKVKCAKCDHRWRQMPVETAEEISAAGPQGMPGTASTADQMSAIAEAIAERLAVAPPAGTAPLVEVVPAAAETPDIPASVIRPRNNPLPTGPITVPSRLNPRTAAKRGGAGRSLILLLGILVGLLAAAYLLSDQIARSIPGAQELYHLVGIEAGSGLKDLQIANIKIVKRDVDGKAAVEITGDIFNESKFPVQAPALRATAKDQDGKALTPVHDFRLEQKTLEPGETASFRTVYEALPDSTKSVTVNFAQ